MKRISKGFFLAFLISVIFSACQENIYMDWKMANEKYYSDLIQAHKNDTDFFITSSGLSYKLIHKGWESTWGPNSTDFVKVNYTGRLINNTIFDSQKAGVLYLPNTIAGWREVLPKYKTGTKLTLYVPSSLAYDTTTSKMPTIPPYSVLIFDLELLDKP